jgi:hypothetical protein
MFLKLDLVGIGLIFVYKRIVRGFMELEKTNSDTVFRYILKNYQFYDFLDVSVNGLPIAFALSTDDPSFKMIVKRSLSSLTEFFYSMVICQSEIVKNGDVPALEYFIIVVNKKTSI